MKKSIVFLSLAMGLLVVSCNSGTTPAQEGAEVAPEKVKTSKDFVPSKAEKDSVSYLLGVNFGSFIKGYNFGDDLNYAMIQKGIKDFLAAEGDMRSPDFGAQFKVDPSSMNSAFNAYLEKRKNYVAYSNKEAGEKFLASNAKRAGVVTTESGLQYEILEQGNDVVPGPVDTVWVRYTGTLLDETVFDQTAADSVRMTLNKVVPGWTEGLQLIGEGGHIKLYIPSELGYGERGTRGIEPNSVLLFDIELTKVGKVPAAEEAEEE